MRLNLHKWLLAAAFLITASVYWPGLSGGYLFDDYPNIVDNPGVQPHDASLPSLVRAALSSPSSEFKRPLASLSFATNYLAAGLDPYWMKLTNLVIHLMNGFLVFLLAVALLAAVRRSASDYPESDEGEERDRRTAALIAAGWMLLPINLTGVLYVVQRMESMANLFVLVGLLGYVTGRRSMVRLVRHACDPVAAPATARGSSGNSGLMLCIASITVPTVLGLLAKETAVMLPLYAALIEWAVFGLRTRAGMLDRRLIAVFLGVLVIPMVLGLAWLLPRVSTAAWSTRDFGMATRLLSEARIVIDYIGWTLIPTPGALSFYHDDFRISTSLLAPWTTLASMALIAGLLVLALWLRSRRPLAALGIALFLGCQLLTGTILPLELIYEHRNYFASFGLLLTAVSLLAVPKVQPFALPRHALLGGLLLLWTALTAVTAYAWGNPLRLAEDLAARAPLSPRAQYELGRTYIIYSRYSVDSPFTKLAYAPLERSMRLPDSSILPEQALIFMNARLNLPLKSVWWASLIDKLTARKATVQDESSLGALTECARTHECALPKEQMMAAYYAALSHPDPSARLLAMYGDYAWNVLADHALGLRMTEEAVKAKPDEPAYQITVVRMLAAEGRKADAERAISHLETMNIGGSLDGSLTELRGLPTLR